MKIKIRPQGSRRAESQAYYQKHRAEISLREKESYQRNREKILRRVKDYASKNKDKIREYSRQWRELNKETNLPKKRAYHYANRERILNKARQYHHANKERNNRKRMEYHRAHPECLLNASAKRRALIRKNQINPAGIKEWMREMRGLPFVRCHWCGTKVSGSDIRFDHVIPIIKGGSHTIGNICASCQECNSSKHDSFPNEWQKNGQSFLSL